MDNLTVLIMAAREYFEADKPIPLDLYMELTQEGVLPEDLEEDFMDGISTEDIVFSYYD